MLWLLYVLFLEFPARKKNDDSHKVVLIPSIIDSEGFFSNSSDLFVDFTHCSLVPRSPSTVSHAAVLTRRHGLSGNNWPLTQSGIRDLMFHHWAICNKHSKISQQGRSIVFFRYVEVK